MSKFTLGDKVRKTKGSAWHGTVVGTYSTELTPEGYAVESATERGSVQIYPAAALELWEGGAGLQAEFEAWASGPEFGLSAAYFAKDERGEYINMPTNNYWLCFRAGRASAVVELPATAKPSDLDYAVWREYGDEGAPKEAEAAHKAKSEYREECRAAIEAAWVTVK